MSCPTSCGSKYGNVVITYSVKTLNGNIKSITQYLNLDPNAQHQAGFYNLNALYYNQNSLFPVSTDKIVIAPSTQVDLCSDYHGNGKHVRIKNTSLCNCMILTLNDLVGTYKFAYPVKSVYATVIMMNEQFDGIAAMRNKRLILLIILIILIYLYCKKNNINPIDKLKEYAKLE